MPFDWIRLCEAHGVEYATSGPNVGRDEIGVHCPFCGAADQSQHMNISLKGRGWHCWRNLNHKGKSRSKLIQAMLGCSWERARNIAGEQVRSIQADEDIGAEVRAALLGDQDEADEDEGPLEFPPEFKPMTTPSPFAARFWYYLESRGYSEEDAAWVVKNYRLHYAITGDYSYRIIIPIFDGGGQLQSWSGRAVGQQLPRYKNLTGSVHSPNKWVLGLPLLWTAPNPTSLFICEGPFDAIRISALGHKYGIYGTCLFGLNLSAVQANLISQLTRFPERRLLLDDDAELRAFAISQKLGNCKRLWLPQGCSDPGELEGYQLRELARVVGA